MKFYNIVNDEEESIGDLWLGIDTDESIKPKPREEGPLHVQITLKIDENNLIEVTAAMEERPDVKVSRTLSRGKADEKLFLFWKRQLMRPIRRNITNMSCLILPTGLCPP